MTFQAEERTDDTADGIEAEAIMQVAMLAIAPLRLPRAVAAKTWIEDIKN